MNETSHAAYIPAAATVIFVAVFLLGYLAFLFQRTLKARIDLYDFLLLSAVAILPSILVFFPAASSRFTDMLGVKYPFVVLFGALFFVVFFYLHRMVVKLTNLVQRERLLAQELALLRERLDSQNTRK